METDLRMTKSQDHLATLPSDAGVFLALDIGGTKIAGGIVNADGRLLQRATVPTEAACGSDRIIANASKLARDLLEAISRFPRFPLLHWGWARLDRLTSRPAVLCSRRQPCRVGQGPV